MSFNEAACNTGGTPGTLAAPDDAGVPRFNEAACNTGGTLQDGLAPGQDLPPASMRPPAIQAERYPQVDDDEAKH